MTEHITVVGTAGTAPKSRTTPTGRTVTSFRLASNIRRRDAATGTWVDAGTNWYTVTAWATLGEHVATSISQGDPVIVAGRLRIDAWSEGERSGTEIEVVAESVGHSLQFGTSSFARSQRRPSDDGAQQADVEAAGRPSAALGASSAPAPAAKDADGWAMPAVVGAGGDETPF